MGARGRSRRYSIQKMSGRHSAGVGLFGSDSSTGSRAGGDAVKLKFPSWLVPDLIVENFAGRSQSSIVEKHMHWEGMRPIASTHSGAATRLPAQVRCAAIPETSAPLAPISARAKGYLLPRSAGSDFSDRLRAMVGRAAQPCPPLRRCSKDRPACV